MQTGKSTPCSVTWLRILLVCIRDPLYVVKAILCIRAPTNDAFVILDTLAAS